MKQLDILNRCRKQIRERTCNKDVLNAVALALSCAYKEEFTISKISADLGKFIFVANFFFMKSGVTSVLKIQFDKTPRIQLFRKNHRNFSANLEPIINGSVTTFAALLVASIGHELSVSLVDHLETMMKKSEIDSNIGKRNYEKVVNDVMQFLSVIRNMSEQEAADFFAKKVIRNDGIEEDNDEITLSPTSSMEEELFNEYCGNDLHKAEKEIFWGYAKYPEEESGNFYRFVGKNCSNRNMGNIILLLFAPD